jgi:hypothetical protein
MSEESIEQVAQSATLETPAEVAQGGSGNDFLGMIPEELRDHPSLSPIKDVENLARSYVNAQRLIGADKIPMPVNPSDEDLDRIYNRLGRPETPQGYEIAVDGSIVTEEVAQDFAEISHKLRLTPDQAKGIMDYYRSSVEQTNAGSTEQAEAFRQTTEESLKSEWGRAYDQKLNQAVNAAKEFSNPEIFDLQLSDGSRLGDNPEFIKTFAKIAEFRQTVTSEDTISENAQANVMTPKQAQAEIDAIMNNRSHAYWDKTNIVGRQQAIQRVQELMGMVHGEA